MENNTDTQKQEVSETVTSPWKTNLETLRVPLREDTLTALGAKLLSIADAIIAGQSLAVATGYSLAPSQEQCAVEKATSKMDRLEKYAWKLIELDSYTLPDIELATIVASSPLSPKLLRIARRRAEALNRLYKTDQAQSHHSAWFSEHHLGYLPSVKAMARVIGAERDLVGGGSWTATQLADLQSLNKILVVTG